MTTTVPPQDHDPITQEENAIQFYCRLLRFMVAILVFWLFVLLLEEEHEYVVAKAFLAAFFIWLILWLIHKCVFIFCFLCPSSVSASEEEGVGALTTAEQDDEEEHFPFEFEETSARLRDCPEPIPMQGPTNGVYTAIYTAYFFGKALRSQGKLQLTFNEEKDNGWTVQGKSIFGKDCNEIQEGFVNAKGQMYYVTSNGCIYRGVLDFASSTMFDGEFKSWKTKGANGRIVRLELSPEKLHDSSVEMTEFPKRRTGASLSIL